MQIWTVITWTILYVLNCYNNSISHPASPFCMQKLGSDHLALVSEFAFAEAINECNEYMSTSSAWSTPASEKIAMHWCKNVHDDTGLAAWQSGSWCSKRGRLNLMSGKLNNFFFPMVGFFRSSFCEKYTSPPLLVRSTTKCQNW